MSLITTPNEYSVEGMVSTEDGNQRVILTQNFEGTQTTYSETSVECIVEDAQGHKQRCVCISEFDGASAARLASLPNDDGTYKLRLTISGGVPTLSWVSE